MEHEAFVERVLARMPATAPRAFFFDRWKHAGRPTEEAFGLWLGAQNEGSYEAYSASYASRFFGIKRSGPRVYQYDREGWLVDRKRMFRKAVTVEADEVAIATSRSTAQLRFIQTWSSGTYSDVGPKQLVFVKEGDELRITREEMLSSKVLREGGAPVEGPARAGFGF